MGVNSRMLNKYINASDKNEVMCDAIESLKLLSNTLVSELIFQKCKKEQLEANMAAVIYDLVKLEQVFNISDSVLERIILSEQYKKEK